MPDASRNIGNAVEAGEVFDQYSMLMATLFDANREISFAIDDNGLRRGVDLYSLTAQQTNTLALLVRDLIIPAALQQRLDQPDLVAPVARDLAQLRAGEAAIRTKAEGAYAPLAEALLATDHIVALPQLAQQALDTGTVPIDAVVENSLGTNADTFGYLVFRDAIRDEITERADDAKAAADARLQRYLVLALLATALAALATWVVSRSITRPLRSLDRQARDLAVDRLPTSVRDILETPLGEDVQVPSAGPIVVKSRDEVGDVVNALNTVQDSALDLAIEQAVLRRNLADSFVNLGRRNQNLLSRQLDFITVLEAAEVEPEVLASLFRLDHLATRMRRNAESLLVLAGIDPPRKWSAPLRLNDVVRAALGEVEDYHRVTAQDFGAVTVMGSVGADLAHLVAELVENALTFSPPGAPVEVRGRPRPDGGFAVADRRRRPGHARPRDHRRQPAPGRPGELHGGAVEVPGPLRGGPPRRPPRHRPAPRAPLGRRRRHRRGDRAARRPVRGRGCPGAARPAVPVGGGAGPAGGAARGRRPCGRRRRARPRRPARRGGARPTRRAAPAPAGRPGAAARAGAGDRPRAPAAGPPRRPVGRPGPGGRGARAPACAPGRRHAPARGPPPGAVRAAGRPAARR